MAPEIARAAPLLQGRSIYDEAGGILAKVATSVDLAGLRDGSLDMLLRSGGAPTPGFHRETIVFRPAAHLGGETVLVSLPGFAGCGEHRALLTWLGRQ